MLRKGRRLGVLEALEQRRLLTLWTVTDLSDVVAVDGQVTLREAIQAAATNEPVNEAIAGSDTGIDQIRFADELFENGPEVFRIEGAIGPLRAMGELAIIGPGVDENGDWLLALDAFVGTQVIVAQGDISVSGVQLQRANGSALLSLSGDVIVENTRFFSNFTENSGGAIVHNGDSLTVRDSVFVSNRATGDGGAISSSGEIVIQGSEFRGSFSAANGGAIASSDSLTVFGSTFIENDASGDGGAIHATRTQAQSRDQARVFASNFLNNTSGGSGGAIYSNFSKNFFAPAEIDLEVGNSVFDSNVANVNGGAISSNEGSASIRETTFSSNVATLGGGVDTTADILIERSTLNGNVAVDGGAIASHGVSDSAKTNIVNTTISGNYATNLGGGVYQDEGELLVTNSTIVLNRSDSNDNGAGNGGGLAVRETDTIADTRLFNTILAGNLRGQTEPATTLTRSAEGSINRWTTEGLATGKYRVLAHWAHDDSPSPLVISDGNVTLATVEQNFLRRPVPHMIDDDLDFESLGEFTITSGELIIEHDDRLNARLLIERVDDAAALNDIHMVNPGTTIDVDKSFHNLVGNPDPSSTGGLEDDPHDLGNANYVGNFGDPWDINRIIFTDLADNLGGATAVHALKPLSPAIDEGSPFLLSVGDGIPFDDSDNPLVGTDPSTGAVAVIQSDGNGGFTPRTDIITADQRGYPFLRADDQTGINARGNAVDIGAFEVQLNPLLRAGEIVVSTLDTFSDGDFSPGNLSLPEAVAIANLRTDHNTIRFTESLIRGDNQIAAMRLTEPLQIEFDTTIAGPGANLLAVTGEQRLFRVSSVADFGLSGLLLGTSSQDARGDAISNSGTTRLDEVVIRDRFQPIINNPSGKLFVSNSQIHDNTGGAIFNQGDLTVGPSVEIYENFSQEDGAGIRSQGSGSIVIFDSIIRNNYSEERGGGLYSSSTTTEIRRSDVTDNTSENGGGGVTIDFGSAFIIDTTIQRNTSARPDGNGFLVPGNTPNGGGVQVRLLENQSLEIDRSTISENEVNDPFGTPNGGGVYFEAEDRESSVTIRSSTISRNTASGLAPSGAGVFGKGQGSSVIESSTIAFNDAFDMQLGSGAGAGARVLARDFTLNNSLVVENHRRPRLPDDEAGNPRFGEQDEDLFGIPDEAINNIVGTGGGVLFEPSNVFGNIVLGAAPSGLVEELNDNGGFTPTHELGPLSPAIDTGERDGLLDQRGFPVTDNDRSAITAPVNGFVLRDLEADIGAYESSEIVLQPFSVENRGNSQFDLGGSALVGVGFDDGTTNSLLAAEPGFLGIELDLDPFVVGPGVAEGFLGDRYGGQATADVDARVGFEYGYYVNSGTVDTFYDGLFAYRVEEDSDTDDTFNISTGVSIQDGALYTNSPNFGAYVDLVFEFNAAIRGEACVIFCVSGGFDINVDQAEPLFSINRQKQDASGNLLFEDPFGNETTTRQDGNSPALDGEVMFSTTALSDIVEGIQDDAIPPEIQAARDGAGGLAIYLNNLRTDRSEAEIEIESLRRKLASRDPDDLREELDRLENRIDKAITDERKVTTKPRIGNPAEGCFGKGLVACLGQAEGDLLGVQVDLAVGLQVGKVGLGKKLGSLEVTLPEIKLSDTEVDSNGRLSATTDDFLLGSPEDDKRQLAALSVDVAAIGPLGVYTADIGPIGIEATTVSYNITPRFAVSQDVSVEPFFDNSHLSSFTFSFDGGGTIDVTVGNGSARTIASNESVQFLPGTKLTVDTNGKEVEVLPELTVGNRFSNQVGLDFDVQGSLEVLALQLNAFGDEIFKVGPLYRDQHVLSESQNLTDLFNKTFNLKPTSKQLPTFKIGGEKSTEPGDGRSPGNAIPLEPSVSSGPIDIADQTSTTYFSVPQAGADGLQRPDIRIETAANGIELIRPPYAGLTLELINSSTTDGVRNDTAISSFEIPIEGVNLATLSIPGWDGEVLSIRGFEYLLGGQAIFGLEFASSNPEITAEAVGGEALSEFRDFEITSFDVLQNQSITNEFLIDNDFAFDIDGDGFISPTTDGELVVRFMNGLTGDALVADVVADGGRRQSVDEITAYLEGLKAPFVGNPFYEVPGRVITETERNAYREGWSKGRRLDVDDSATIDPQTGEILNDGIDPAIDGVLILRHMAGIGVSIASSPALTTGFTTEDLGRRNIPQDISDFIDGKNHTVQLVSKDEPLRGSVRQDFLLTQEGNIGLDAVPGSSPYNPIKTSFVSSIGTYVLSEFGQTTTYEELILTDGNNGDIVVSRNAAETPSRSYPVPQSLTRFATDPFADEIDDLPLRRSDPVDRLLGVDADAPLFVELPDAAGYRVSLADGMTFDVIDIDSAAAGNGFFDQDRSLGLTLADITDVSGAFRTEFGITRDQGAVITDIEAGSVGDRFGLEVGDVVTRFNTTTVDSAYSFEAAMRLPSDGLGSEVGYFRGAAESSVAVPLADFDLYVESLDQWFEVTMDTPLNLPDGVSEFDLFPKASPNVDLLFAENEGPIDLDLSVGFVLSGNVQSDPGLQVTILAERTPPVSLSPYIDFGTFDFVEENEIRISRDGAYVNLNVNGVPTPLTSEEGLDIQFEVQQPESFDQIIESGTLNNATASFARGGFNGTSFFMQSNLDQSQGSFDFELGSLPVGTYEISTTWRRDDNRPDDVTYVVQIDGVTVDTFMVDQTQFPTPDHAVQNFSFEVLGEVEVPENADSVVVRVLTNDSAVYIDAIRIENALIEEEFLTVELQPSGFLDGLSSLAFTTPPHAQGNAIVTMVVTDQEGLQFTDTFQFDPSLSVFSPAIVAPIVDQYLPQGTTSHTIDLAGLFDNELYTLTATSSNSDVGINLSGKQLSISFTEDVQQSVITINAMDGQTFVARDTFLVTTSDRVKSPGNVLKPIRDDSNFQFIFNNITSQSDFTFSSVANSRLDFDVTFNGLVNTFVFDANQGPLDLPIRILGTAPLESMFNGEIQDRVRIDGEGVELDLVGRDSIADIPIIDIRGSGSNRLRLDSSSVLLAGWRPIPSDPVLGSSGETRLLYVIQDTDDHVLIEDLSDWTEAADPVVGPFDRMYSEFTTQARDAFGNFNPLRLFLSVPDQPSSDQTPAVIATPDRDPVELNRDAESSNPPSQIITLRLDDGQFVTGDTYTVDIGYEVTDATQASPGVLVEVHYDSSVMSFNHLTNLSGESDFVPSVNANNTEDIELIDDGSTETDSVVVLAWSDIRGTGNDWESSSTDRIRLATLNFTIDADVVDPLVRATGESSTQFQFLTTNLNPVDPAITWPTPQGVVFGTALSETQLNASSPIEGTFEYDLPSGTVLSAGTGQPLTVTFTPTDVFAFNTVTETVTIDVLKALPIVSWANPAAINFGTLLSATQLNATTEISGTFTYTPALGARLSGGAGQVLSATFVPSDTSNYNPVTTSVIIDVLAVDPALAWTEPSEIVFGTSLSGTQLNATSTIPGTFVYSPSLGTQLNAGADQVLSVTFNPADAASFNSITRSVTIDVAKADPTISWASPADVFAGTVLSPTQLNATADVNGTFQYSPAAGTILEAGLDQTLAATFTPDDANNFNTVTSSVLIDVLNVGDPDVSWAAPQPIVFGQALSDTQLNASSSIAGVFSYNPPVGTVLNAGDAQTLSVTFTPNDQVQFNTVTDTVTIDVAKADPQLVWGTPGSIASGTPLTANQLNASADIDGTFTYNPAIGTILDDGSQQELSVAFVPTDQSNYNNAVASVLIDVTSATGFDFGDAPAAFPVTLAQDGARHTTGSLTLGGQIDAETDGIASADASSDGVDDDGVTALTAAIANASSRTISSFAIVASDAGKLDAWIDFNNNGTWEASEQIFTSVDVAQGATTLSYEIPAGATAAGVGARFRLSTAGGLGVTGAAADGEVEDYVLNLEAAGNNHVSVTSINPGTTTIETAGDDVIVREGDVILFQGPASELAVLDLTGSDGDDTINLTATIADFASGISLQGGTGTDTLTITGEGQVLDTTILPDGSVTGVEVVDIRGSGSNMLTLTEDDVASIPDSGQSLRVMQDIDDTLNIVDGDFQITGSFFDEGQFIVQAQSGQATIEVEGLTWTNPIRRLDVNNSGTIEPIDALQILNQLSRQEFVVAGSNELEAPANLSNPFPLRFFDTSGDGTLTPIDALRVLNGLFRGEGEGERLAGSLESTTPPITGLSPMKESDFEDEDIDDLLSLNNSDATRHLAFASVGDSSTILANSTLNQITATDKEDEQDERPMAIDQALNELLW